jgi:hypothetical protein
MPSKDERSQILYGRTQSYSLSVEGTPAVLRSAIVTQEDFTAGDKVELFSLPDGRIFISKVDPNSKDAYTVGRVTPAHIYFDDEITVEEK